MPHCKPAPTSELDDLKEKYLSGCICSLNPQDVQRGILVALNAIPALIRGQSTVVDASNIDWTSIPNYNPEEVQDLINNEGTIEFLSPESP